MRLVHLALLVVVMIFVAPHAPAADLVSGHVFIITTDGKIFYKTGSVSGSMSTQSIDVPEYSRIRYSFQELTEFTGSIDEFIAKHPDSQIDIVYTPGNVSESELSNQLQLGKKCPDWLAVSPLSCDGGGTPQ